MATLLERFLRFECNEDIRRLLQVALTEVADGRQPLLREFNFNVFDVMIDGEERVVVLEDILDVSESGTVRISIEAFAAALETGAGV